MSSSLTVSARRFSTLEEWLAWFETLHPKKIDFSLDRVRKVLAALDLAEPACRVITVGGTNGKGSCVAILESIYRCAGYRVGAFTSPHLWRFNERIRCNGHDAADRDLIEIFETIDAALGDVTLSYFESSAVAALLHFARERVDVAILEVGMGGRLDAVNAIDADAALVVSVDLDHLDWLGPDREAIGREKAGIVRRDRPVVVADEDPPRSLLATIDSEGAIGCLVGRDYAYETDGAAFRFVEHGREPRRFPRPAFGGDFQVQNAASCVAVVEKMQSALPVPDEAIARGIAEARPRGRIERYRLDGVEWVFDVAHNAAAAARLHATLEAGAPAEPTLAVFGAMRDKQLAEVIDPFVKTVAAWHVCPIDSERGASTVELAALLERHGAREVVTHDDVASAASAARGSPAARVIVFGSFYTVGPAMEALELYCAPSSAE